MKWMTGSVLLAILWGLPGLAWAEENPTGPPRQNNPRTLQPIRLGMTREEVRELWGPPHTMYVPPIEEEDFDSREDYDYGVMAYTLLSDAYRRQTARNQYEVRVYYSYDRRKDAQRPEMRAFLVRLKPSRSVPLMRTLRDVPEAAELCRSGCEMWGDKVLPEISVFPQHPSLSQRRLAELVAYKWKPMPPSERDDKHDWTPTVDLHLKKWSGYKERTVHEIEWMDRPIDQVEITINTPRSLIELLEGFYIGLGEVGKRLGPKFLKLGHFSPGEKGAANVESRR